MHTRKVAELIVRAIKLELYGRAGFGDLFEEIDNEVLQELTSTLEEVVNDILVREVYELNG